MTLEEIEKAIKSGDKTVEEISLRTSACTCCSSCYNDIEYLLEREKENDIH